MASNQALVSYLNQLTSSINTNYVIISTSIGVPLNLICMFTFWRLMKNNKTNMGFLGICQSFIDMTILLMFLFVYRAAPIFFSILPANRANAECKIFGWIRRFILHASSWIAVVSTFDRFTYVLYGHENRLKFLKNKSTLSGCILAIFVLIGILNIPNLFFYISGGACIGNFDATISSDIISILLRTYIPFGLMVVFNWLMIRKLFKSNRRSSRTR